MRKQILALTMCVALTATATFATSATVAAKTTARRRPAAVKKVSYKSVKKVVKTTTPVACKTATPETPALTPEETARKNFEARMEKARDSFYTKLGLSCDQKTKAEALDKKNREAASPLFDAVRSEKMKLHQLKAKKASCVALYKQEQKVKAAKKALRAHMDASRKDFEALLTKAQLAKFKAMKPARKFGCPCHRHHGQMGPQGPAPVGQAPADAPAPAIQCPCKK